MGHLTNPVGFRLGRKKNWKDTWFVKNLYYPEYSNTILNIRDYLYYFLTRKKMLLSGVCFSHLNLLKLLKGYFVKIYIYHIDLEKLSYDFINKVYRTYYRILSRITKFNIAPAKRGNVSDKVKSLRELHNSDLFLIYFTFCNFVADRNIDNIEDNVYAIPSLLKNNVFLKNKLVKSVSRKLVKSVSNFSVNKLLHRWGPNALARKRLFRKKFKYWRNNYLKTISDFVLTHKTTDILSKEQKKISVLLFRRKFFNLKKHVINFLSKKYRNTFSYESLKKLLTRRLIRIHTDKYVRARLRDTTKLNCKTSLGISVMDLFFFIMKKIGFRRYRNTKGLHKKLMYAIFYMNNLTNVRFLSGSKNFKSFIYTLWVFAFMNYKSYVKRIKYRASLRDDIYMSLYYFIGENFFFEPFRLVTRYIKSILNLMQPTLKCDASTHFTYHFLSNANVTSRLLAYYLALKLKKGFSVFNCFNPVRRELIRLSVSSRTNKRVYKFFNYSFFRKRKQKLCKIKFKNYLISSYKSFKSYFYNRFVNSNSFVYYNIYKFYKLYPKKVVFGPRERFKKISYINIFYTLLLNLNRNMQFRLYYFFRKSTIFLFKFLLTSINGIFNYFSENIIFKNSLNQNFLFLSNFFLKNLINFQYLKYIWLNFKKLNARNIKRNYIQKYNSHLLGFKVSFKGRFSRKQRAAFVWIHEGKVPLNTLDMDLDYCFLTIPLKNSIASIKVWLYKKKHIERFKYSLKT